MKSKVTYLQVKEGKVWATNRDKPNYCNSFIADDRYCSSCAKSERLSCSNQENKFNQSFVEVSNPLDIKSWWYPILGNSFTTVHDGLYAAPEGLVMEVKLPDCECSECQNNGYTKATHKKRFAVISFEPVEHKAAPSHSSEAIEKILDSITPEEQAKTDARMLKQIECKECENGECTALCFICEQPEPKDKEQVPDFEAMAKEYYKSLALKSEYCGSDYITTDFKAGAERVWKEFQEDREWFKMVDMANKDFNKKILNLESELQGLQEENKRLREQLNQNNGQ